MKKILKNVGKVALALGLCVFTSTIARAVWDSTTGNMPNFYRLCWGLDKVACIYGSSISDNVSIQTGGTDAITIDSAQAVVMSGSLSVTGAVTIPDSTIVTAKLAADSVVTAKILNYSVVTQKLYLDVPSAKVACITTAKSIGACTGLALTGVCGVCN